MYVVTLWSTTVDDKDTIMPKYISYLRVSTQRQGRSGLGLEAQRNAVAAHAADGAIIREFQEVESGKRQDRPQLDAALKECKLTGATLLVAKLDRLARNVEFTARLMNSGVDFVAADNPHANRLTIHILAAMAEHEREQISHRTKAALAAAKRRGVKLGGKRKGSGWRGGNQFLGAEARIAAALAYSHDLRDVLADIGPGSLRRVAAELTARSIKTPRGGAWTAAAVQRVQRRLGAN
jgi:DNA invertase Pin-like site-specific DNA recombinase